MLDFDGMKRFFVLQKCIEKNCKFFRNSKFSIHLIAPSWKLVGCPLDAAPGEGLPLVLNWGHVGFLDELVAGKDKSLPYGFQRRGIDWVAALVVEEFLVDFVLVVFRGGSKGLRFGHHYSSLLVGIRPFLEEIRPRCLHVGGKGGQLLLRKQPTVFHHRRRPQIPYDPRGVPAGLGFRREQYCCRDGEFQDNSETTAWCASFCENL
jgi:hypothetical protein